jgi:hypothetical protein
VIRKTSRPFGREASVDERRALVYVISTFDVQICFMDDQYAAHIDAASTAETTI